MEIIEFIGNDSKKAVLENPELAERLLFETLELNPHPGNCEALSFIDCRNDIYRGELLTIEKVGKENYGNALVTLLNIFPATSTFDAVITISTAEPIIKVAACLLALSRKPCKGVWKNKSCTYGNFVLSNTNGNDELCSDCYEIGENTALQDGTLTETDEENKGITDLF